MQSTVKEKERQSEHLTLATVSMCAYHALVEQGLIDSLRLPCTVVERMGKTCARLHLRVGYFNIVIWWVT